MAEPSPPTYDTGICARLHAFECDLTHHRVTLWLGSGEVAYMPGAVRFALRLGPACKADRHNERRRGEHNI